MTIEHSPENCRLMRPGGCFVPERFKHLRWHVLKQEYPTGILWERAEWVNNPENGPSEMGHWVRWGYCGDFPSLCKADYVGPAIDQESPYVEFPWEERFEEYPKTKPPPKRGLAEDVDEPRGLS